MRMLKWLSSLSLAFHRENEFDDGTPGKPRRASGLFSQLSDEQKKAVLSYDGPEASGVSGDPLDKPNQ